MMKRVYILVGPKGVGKSFLGGQLSQKCGIKFLRVEDIWIKLKDCGLSAQEYEDEGCLQVVQAVSQLLNDHNQVVIESVGASALFEKQRQQLSVLAKLFLIRLRAPLELCLQRVKERDQKLHLNVSDERVMAINRIASQFELDWDCDFENTGTPEKFVADFRARFLMQGSEK